MSDMTDSEQRKANLKRRGFGSMDAARQREIASMGGRAAHLKGTAHSFTTAEAVLAARKSVAARAAKRKAAAKKGAK